jgi:hypothetical protein
MKSEGRSLPRATPELAQRVWARQQRPSARRVARPMQQAGYHVHFATIVRWRAQNWPVKASEHPLEIARGRLETVAPLVSGHPETTIQSLIDGSARSDFDELTDGEVLRRAARETAIATALVAKAIQNRATTAFNMTELTPALFSIAACLAALPGAFDQAIILGAADQRSNSFRTNP